MITYYLGMISRECLSYDRSTKYKGKLENHAYELFLSLEGISRSITQVLTAEQWDM